MKLQEMTNEQISAELRQWAEWMARPERAAAAVGKQGSDGQRILREAAIRLEKCSKNTCQGFDPRFDPA